MPFLNAFFVTVPTTKWLRFFIGFLDVLGPNYFVVGTV